MSENKHTPEPWHLCEVENETGRIKHLVPVDSEKLSLLTIVENDQGTFAAIYNDEDARRIVACVNACAGTDTEDLEEIVKHGTITPVQAASEIAKQRDELLAALEKIAKKCNLDMHGDDGSLGGYAYGIWNTANTAIASMKGYGKPEKSAKTEVPAIVFFPAGSLGEEIEEEGRPA